jgi:hypothetical protein
MSNNPIVSTGRGGAGNIGHDNNTYTDGGIIREGYGEEPGVHSTGRGGAGNLGKSPLLGPQETSGRRSTDIIPETALRQPQETFHTGRGGGGNVYKEKYGGHSHAPSDGSNGGGVKEKVKALFGKDGKKEQPPN